MCVCVRVCVTNMQPILQIPSIPSNSCYLPLEAINSSASVSYDGNG